MRAFSRARACARTGTAAAASASAGAATAAVDGMFGRRSGRAASAGFLTPRQRLKSCCFREFFFRFSLGDDEKKSPISYVVRLVSLEVKRLSLSLLVIL